MPSTTPCTSEPYFFPRPNGRLYTTLVVLLKRWSKLDGPLSVFGLLKSCGLGEPPLVPSSTWPDVVDGFGIGKRIQQCEVAAAMFEAELQSIVVGERRWNNGRDVAESLDRTAGLRA